MKTITFGKSDKGFIIGQVDDTNVYSIDICDVKKSLTGLIEPGDYKERLLSLEFLTLESLDVVIEVFSSLRELMQNDPFAIKSIEFIGKTNDKPVPPLYSPRVSDGFSEDEDSFDPFFEIDEEC